MSNYLLFLLASFSFTLPAAAQSLIVITAPAAGQAVQGVVPVTGTTQVDGFQSAEVAFAYADDSTGTWFILQESQTAVLSGTLAAWNTSVITDGTYALRLRVFLADGNVLETIVTGIRVRNYTPVETATPNALAPPATRLTSASTPTEWPTPTALAANPAGVTPASVYQAMGRGALAILALFLLVGLLTRLRRR